MEKEAKKYMVEFGGYDEIVIEDFYEIFMEEFKKLDQMKDTFDMHCLGGGVNFTYA